MCVSVEEMKENFTRPDISVLEEYLRPSAAQRSSEMNSKA